MWPSCWDPADRRSHEHDLVREYHRALSGRGVTGYPWDQCWTDYRRYAYQGLAILVPAAMLVEQTPRGDETFLTMIRRASGIITSSRTRSGLDAATARSASAPLAAVTTSKPANRRDPDNSSKIVGSSSTTRIRASPAALAASPDVAEVLMTRLCTGDLAVR